MTTRVLAKDLCEKAFQRLMLRRETFGRGVVLNTAVEFGHVQKTQKNPKIPLRCKIHSQIRTFANNDVEMIYIKMGLGILIANTFCSISSDFI